MLYHELIFSVEREKSVLIVAEHFLQTFAGEEYTALYSAQRQGELIGYLRVFVSFYVHGERYLVLLREVVDDSRNLLCRERAFGGVETTLLRQVQVIEILGGVNDSGRADLAAVVVDEDIAHYSEYPALEIYVLDILRFVVQNFEGSILYQIHGRLFVGGELESKIREIALEAQKALFES